MDKIIGLELLSDRSDDELGNMISNCLTIERDLSQKLKHIRCNLHDVSGELGFRSLTRNARVGLSPYALAAIGKIVAGYR